MPYGLLVGLVLHGALIVLTLAAPRRPAWLAGLAFRVSAAYNEAPVIIAYIVLAGAIPGLLDTSHEPVGRTVALALTVLLLAALGLIFWRGTAARPVVERALEDALGRDWSETIEPSLRVGLRHRLPLSGILMPIAFRPRDVERVPNLSYGDAGRANLLDLYRHRSRPTGAPVLIHFHGGGYYGGRKNVESRALLHRFARRGWVTVSANYRLRPQAGFYDHLADAKKVIAWVRRHGHEYGADPSIIVLAGGSAGGHMSTIAALTQNDPRYQPGFEAADTTVSAVVSLYGWHGGYYEIGGPASPAGPLGHDAATAPPFFIAHGRRDSLAHVETARRTVEHLRAGSAQPVVYAELPHGQHAFDLFHSPRFSAVVDGVEAFTAALRSRA